MASFRIAQIVLDHVRGAARRGRLLGEGNRAQCDEQGTRRECGSTSDDHGGADGGAGMTSIATDTKGPCSVRSARLVVSWNANFSQR